MKKYIFKLLIFLLFITIEKANCHQITTDSEKNIVSCKVSGKTFIKKFSTNNSSITLDPIENGLSQATLLVNYSTTENGINKEVNLNILIGPLFGSEDLLGGNKVKVASSSSDLSIKATNPNTEKSVEILNERDSLEKSPIFGNITISSAETDKLSGVIRLRIDETSIKDPDGNLKSNGRLIIKCGIENISFINNLDE